MNGSRLRSVPFAAAVVLSAQLPLAAQSAPAAAPVAPAAAPIAVTGMPAGAPLSVTARATPTSLSIHVQIDEGWHLYGRDTGGGRPVAVECLPDSAFVAAGPLRLPMDERGQITGRQDLVLPLRAAAAGALRAKMSFMVCDALQCLPPIELTLAGTPGGAAAARLAVLLVAVAADARAERIAAFLKDRGCAVTVATWNDVTAAQCDAADVVLADSPLHGHTKPADPARFPATGTPVVAVGFLGTALLEAQKVTMACGYI
jgi:hypothetical protein